MISKGQLNSALADVLDYYQAIMNDATATTERRDVAAAAIFALTESAKFVKVGKDPLYSKIKVKAARDIRLKERKARKAKAKAKPEKVGKKERQVQEAEHIGDKWGEVLQ